jgi:Cof subfamily protein (haloacid dehalogenase superfamily)
MKAVNTRFFYGLSVFSCAASFHNNYAFLLIQSRANIPQKQPSNNAKRERRIVQFRAAPDKGDLYSNDELMDLLSLHQALNDGQEDEVDYNSSDEAAIPGIHDLVLQTLGDIESSSFIPQTFNVELEDESNSQLEGSMNTLMALLRDKKPTIRAIASDVDGTLLSSGQELHPITLDAVLKAIDQSKSSTQKKIHHFFAATGKSRAGAAGSLGPIIGPLLYQCPGVYIQGLYCVDADNNVLFEKKLPQSAVKAAEDLVAEFGISIIGYDGDDLYSTELTETVVELSEFYGEPTVKLIMKDDSVAKLVEHEPGLHKLLLMDEDVEKLSSIIRPKLEQLAEEHDATVTQAIPTMLELLPKGCSKAFGVQKVCEALGIQAETELLALGDAENDVGMLQMASIGVAVGNACPQARDAADFIMKEKNNEGGAGLAMSLFGFDD